MGYVHFTTEERSCLRFYYKKGLSYRKIAELLGRNVSSVSRELRRNCTYFNVAPSYYPQTAQRKSDLRRSYCHRGMFWNADLISYIEEKLLATWSPEQISNTPSPFEKMPSTRTIYRWLYDKYLLKGNLKVLRRKGRSRLGKEGRGSAPHVISLSVEGVRAEVLLHALEERGVYVSAGSACSSNRPHLSETLKAIGTPKELLDATIRLSLSVMNTEEEIDAAAAALAELIPFLRKYTRH